MDPVFKTWCETRLPDAFASDRADRAGPGWNPDLRRVPLRSRIAALWHRAVGLVFTAHASLAASGLTSRASRPAFSSSSMKPIPATLASTATASLFQSAQIIAANHVRRALSEPAHRFVPSLHTHENRITCVRVTTYMFHAANLLAIVKRVLPFLTETPIAAAPSITITNFTKRFTSPVQ